MLPAVQPGWGVEANRRAESGERGAARPALPAERVQSAHQRELTEYDLLRTLSVNAGRVLTHEFLLRRVWGPQNSGDARLVRAFVKKLRRKLGDVATQPRLHRDRASGRLPHAQSRVQ